MLTNQLSTFHTDRSLYKGLRIQGYPEVHEKVTEIVARTVLAGSTVLDLATGQGALAQRLMDLGYPVCGTSWNDKFKVAQAAIFRLNLDEGFGVGEVGGTHYQCVLAAEVIEHLRNPFQFLTPYMAYWLTTVSSS